LREATETDASSPLYSLITFIIRLWERNVGNRRRDKSRPVLRRRKKQVALEKKAQGKGINSGETVSPLRMLTRLNFKQARN